MSKIELYTNALSKTLEVAAKDADNLDKDTLKRIVFYGIKSLKGKDKPEDYKGLMRDFNLTNVVKESVARLTPREFMTVFPIAKTYDGGLDWKDYYSTMEAVNEIGIDNVIGDQASNFLMEYDNLNVRLFLVEGMSIISSIRQFEGKPSLTQEWVGQEGINTYTEHTDGSGKKYMMDKNGRAFKISKPRPNYLKLV